MGKENFYTDNSYVLAVSVKEPLWVGDEQHQADVVAAQLATSDWVRLCCGDGAKGPRIYDRTRVRFHNPMTPYWHRWLLVRRSGSLPGSGSTILVAMVSMAGTGWTIETGFETAQGEVDLDQHEVRSWANWDRHITLSMVAHALLHVARAQGSQQETKKGDLNASISHSVRKLKRKRGLKFP